MNYTMSHHAASRAAERGIHDATIRRTLKNGKYKQGNSNQDVMFVRQLKNGVSNVVVATLSNITGQPVVKTTYWKQ